jgi:hypothetical protein
MADQPGSTSFQLLFDSALQGYERKTGVNLIKHPLALQLQNCHSVEEITSLLQGQTQAFNDFRENDKIIKSIEIIVSILSPLSAAASLTNAVGVVRRNVLVTSVASLIPPFHSDSFHLRQQYRPASVSCLMYVLYSTSYATIIVTFSQQAAKGVISDSDTLVDLLESIGHFVGRLKIYTRIPLEPTMAEIVVKIMIELIATLALVTEKLKQRRPSAFFLAH